MIRRIPILLVGLVCCGVAIGLMVRAEIGVAPWDVLAQGIAGKTGWAFGFVTVGLGVLVLLAWIPLRERPGVGTVINVLAIGPVADVTLRLVPVGLPLWARILLFAGGLLLMAVGTGIYIGTLLGNGPRDGLMTGLHRRLGWPIWVGRTLIEGTVLAVGWMLGGNVGIGTVLFALLIGPLCSFTLPWFSLPWFALSRRGRAVMLTEPAVE